jgi:hypothetical protein
MRNTILILFFAVICCGCESADFKCYPISGTVTYNGESFPHGTIVFTPDSSKENSGPQYITSIIDGKYDTGKNGPIAGPMIVEISGVHALTTDGPNGPSGLPLFSGFEERFEMPHKPFQKDFNITGPPVKIVR